jgi:hypothetical protein
MLMFWNTVCSICIGSVSRKNNLNESVGVFLGENIWFENSHSQSFGRVEGKGHVQVEKRAVEGKDPKWRPVIHM